MKYILVEWPQSQQFIDDSRCHVCIKIEGAMFVPEKVYNYYIKGDINAFNKK